jgi:rare lipoprotein A
MRKLIVLAALCWAAFFLVPCASASVASFYGGKFHGRLTANGERFNKHAMTCAHRTYPFGTRLRVTFHGRSAVCRVNDRGPFIIGRDIDLSEGVARAIGFTLAGVGNVSIEEVD